jgi:hypothetical protein
MTVNPATLSLNSIVNVVVNVTPQAAPRSTFNQLLILGNSGRIPQSMRIMQVDQNFATEMIAQGFLTSDPEYIAASLYFGSVPAPTSGYIGMMDPTAIQSVIPHLGAIGNNYALGDIITVVQTGGSGAQFTVTGITSSPAGAVTGLTKINGSQGTGYTAGSNLSTTTTGSGSGLKVDITALGESCLDALQVLRQINIQWYVAVALTAVDADHEAIALWVQSCQPPSVYAYSTSEAAVLSGSLIGSPPTESIGAYLKALSYGRVVGQYSTLQAGQNPYVAYAICAILGYAMGQNTGLINSAYSLKFKGEVGIATEPLTLTQIANIEGANVNLYLSYGNFYNWFEQGVMANGTFFDQVINRDMLVNDIQLNLATLLNGTPKIPQTDPGQTQLIHAVNQAAQKAVDRGYLAPGVFNPLNGLPLLSLNPGEAMPLGYTAMSAPYSTQLSADRIARKAMPIYLVIHEAGAVHSVTVQVNVQI